MPEFLSFLNPFVPYLAGLGTIFLLLVIGFFSDRDWPWYAPLGIFVVIVVAAWSAGYLAISWFIENPQQVIGFTVGYFIGGVAYAFWKWTFVYVPNAVKALEGVYRRSIRNPPVRETSDTHEGYVEKLKKQWTSAIGTWDAGNEGFSYEGFYFQYDDNGTPELNVTKSKAVVATWMIWWPADGAWYLTDHYVLQIFQRVRDIFNWAFEQIKGYLARIANRQTAVLSVDFDEQQVSKSSALK